MATVIVAGTTDVVVAGIVEVTVTGPNTVVRAIMVLVEVEVPVKLVERAVEVEDRTSVVVGETVSVVVVVVATLLAWTALRASTLP